MISQKLRRCCRKSFDAPIFSGASDNDNVGGFLLGNQDFIVYRGCHRKSFDAPFFLGASENENVAGF